MFPVWMQENALSVFVFSFALLLIFLCYENWPKWLHSSRDWQWADLETGGRYYRDLLVGFGMTDAVKMFDSMASPHPKQPISSPVAGAFRWVVQEAVNENQMEVWGTPENGSKPERLENVDDDANAYRRSREGDSFFLMMDGVYYRDLQIKRSTIKSYAEHVRSHDAELKRSAEARKIGRIHK